MKRKMRIDNFAGFHYLSLINVPVRSSKEGDVIDMNPENLEIMVAKAMIEKQIPIRGKELKFLRKILGFSLEKFARAIDLSATSVFKWEKDEGDRLATVNEIVVRAFIAERLGLGNKSFSFLKGTDTPAGPIELKVS